MNLCQGPQSLWQPGFLHSKRWQLCFVMQSALIRLYSKFSFKFSQSSPFIAMWSHPKRIQKHTSSICFWCSSCPLPFFSPSRGCQLSEYLQCFCSINGFTLSSRHQKGSVLALILCLYWAGGGFKPSSIFGFYSKLSDLRAIYWCSISYFYSEALLSLEWVKNSHNTPSLCPARITAETLSSVHTGSLPCACTESHKAALPWLTSPGNMNAQRENPISPSMLFG